jgi:hypothetical protein
MRKLRFLSAQPATDYYAWQVEVMIHNFMSMGINPNDIEIVCLKSTPEVPQNWSKLANRYPARFFFYEDTRRTKHYPSSTRPNVLKQHFKEHPYLSEEAIFYHDCDILFTKPVREWMTREMIDDDKWYGSDTRWYISHDYIISKGVDVLTDMCTITSMPPEVIKENELNSIGAQYLMKGIDSAFWERVEIDSENLFKKISLRTPIYAAEWKKKVLAEGQAVMHGGKLYRVSDTEFKSEWTYHELQIWCADMWAVLWGAWRRGQETVCHPAFDFSWATSTADVYKEKNIFHNAGVTDENQGLFLKTLHMTTLPYNQEYKIRENSASKMYWDWVKEVGRKSALI